MAPELPTTTSGEASGGGKSTFCIPRWNDGLHALHEAGGGWPRHKAQAIIKLRWWCISPLNAPLVKLKVLINVQ